MKKGGLGHRSKVVGDGRVKETPPEVNRVVALTKGLRFRWLQLRETETSLRARESSRKSLPRASGGASRSFPRDPLRGALRNGGPKLLDWKRALR